MKLLRGWLMAMACAGVLSAQAEPGPVRRGYLGLQLGSSGTALTCGRPANACEKAWTGSQLPGTQLSLVGRVRLTDTFRVEGHFGTLFGPAEPPVTGAPPALGTDAGFRKAYGAGLRWAFAPAASATLGLDSYELPLAGGGRETVRAATLGLQWRY